MFKHDYRKFSNEFASNIAIVALFAVAFPVLAIILFGSLVADMGTLFASSLLVGSFFLGAFLFWAGWTAQVRNEYENLETAQQEA